MPPLLLLPVVVAVVAVPLSLMLLQLEHLQLHPPPPCALAFDRVCTHALTLLAHDVSDIDMVAPQPERILFNVGMRNVTVIHVTFAL